LLSVLILNHFSMITAMQYANNSILPTIKEWRTN